MQTIPDDALTAPVPKTPSGPFLPKAKKQAKKYGILWQHNIPKLSQ